MRSSFLILLRWVCALQIFYFLFLFNSFQKWKIHFCKLTLNRLCFLNENTRNTNFLLCDILKTFSKISQTKNTYRLKFGAKSRHLYFEWEFLVHFFFNLNESIWGLVVTIAASWNLDKSFWFWKLMLPQHLSKKFKNKISKLSGVEF